MSAYVAAAKSYFVKFNISYLPAKTNHQGHIEEKSIGGICPGALFKKLTNCQNIKIRAALSYLKTNSTQYSLAYFQNNSCRSQVTFC